MEKRNKRLNEVFDRVKADAKTRFRTLIEAILLMCVAIGVALGSGWFVKSFLETTGIADGIVSGYIEAAVAAVSAGFVVLQLKSGENQEKRQTDVDEAEFILEYNKSFIENEKLTEIERYLECRLTGVEYGDIKNLEDRRQDMVNYLVYLEGLASCILSDILKFERVDDLLAYRFFIAMNNIEVQSIELLPYASYYRGCFRLYEKWLEYRMECGKYSAEDHWEVPLYDTALCNYYGYEKYACPEMDFNVTEKTEKIGEWPKVVEKQGYTVFRASINKYKWVELWVDPDNKVKIKYSKKAYKKRAVYLSLLRRVLKELVYAEQSNEKIVRKLAKNNKEFDFCDVDADAMQLLNEIRYTRDIKIARDQPKPEAVRFFQLNNDTFVSEENLKAISALIYGTDEYIYPHMFGNEAIALEILPQLFESGADEMFQKKNLFISQVNGRVVGIILWYKGELEWSKDLLEQKIADLPAEDDWYKGVDLEKLKKTLEQVSKEYVSKKYSEQAPRCADRPKSDIAILNVCIDPNVRGMKIASEMLEEFLKQEAFKDQSFELCVLTKNTSAIKLYSRNGFAQIDVEPAYPEKKNHTRAVMRRPKEGNINNAPLS